MSGAARTMVYQGSDERLYGKTALVRSGTTVEVEEGVVFAQFDDVETGYGYGWHPFQATSFSELKTEDHA